MQLLIAFALLIHVLIASTVTVHVLLRKSDVRAALGWIAIAWLSILIGGALYYVFGINRVTRRASRFADMAREEDGLDASIVRPTASMNIAALSDISLHVTGSPLLAGNQVSLLRGGDNAYPMMLAAIRDAERSIALESYIFRNDDIGRSFVEALTQAQRRGVAVRVLLDGVGSGYVISQVLHELESTQVPVARFLHTWLPWRMPFLNMRNHKKLLIIDGEVGFTGGLNIGAEYSAQSSPRAYVDDIHLRVQGPVVKQLMESFARDWSFTTNEILDDGTWWPSLNAKGAVFARGIDSGPDADLYKLETLLGAALAQAHFRVRIVTPYFLPDQRLQFAIAQARLRGVLVEIVIPGRGDLIFVDWAVRAHLRFLGDDITSIYLGPPPFDHAKLMTVDGEWCLVGSSNWDTRSLRLNFEFDLECYDKELCAHIDDLIDHKIARSQRIDESLLAAGPKWAHLRDAAVRLLLPYL